MEDWCFLETELKITLHEWIYRTTIRPLENLVKHLLKEASRTTNTDIWCNKSGIRRQALKVTTVLIWTWISNFLQVAYEPIPLNIENINKMTVVKFRISSYFAHITSKVNTIERIWSALVFFRKSPAASRRGKWPKIVHFLFDRRDLRGNIYQYTLGSSYCLSWCF